MRGGIRPEVVASYREEVMERKDVERAHECADAYGEVCGLAYCE